LNRTLKKLYFAFRMWLRNHMIAVSAVGSILFLVITAIGVMGTFFSPDGALYDGIGNWDMVMFGVGAIILGVFAYYLYDTVMTRKKFDELMNVQSRRKFVKNLDEIDFLAHKLPDSDWKRYQMTRKKYKIKG